MRIHFVLLVVFFVLQYASILWCADRIECVAGGDQAEVNLPATQARLYEPFGTEFDAQGNMWILEMASGNRLLKVDSNGTLTHFAGKHYKAIVGEQNMERGDGKRGLEAAFNGPHNLAVPRTGHICVADTWNGAIRTIDPNTAQVSSLPGYSIPIDKARNMGPYCIALDQNQTRLLVADLNQIHSIDLRTGMRILIAGNGKKGVPADGALASESPLVDPRAVAVDSKGNTYILERGGNSLRVVTNDGKIRTVVNRNGKKGISDTAGPAIDAMMNGPKHLCIDKHDRVLIADAENHIVIRYDPQKEVVTRIAGTGAMGRMGIGGEPTSCQLARPHGVTVHPTSGEIYITDSYNDRILKIVSGSAVK